MENENSSKKQVFIWTLDIKKKALIGTIAFLRKVDYYKFSCLSRKFLFYLLVKIVHAIFTLFFNSFFFFISVVNAIRSPLKKFPKIKNNKPLIKKMDYNVIECVSYKK